MTKFAQGQIVSHKKFGYRGVIFQVDPQFELSDEWYEAVARSRPRKDAPWYHVLVDRSEQTTYVAERHLALSDDSSQIEHPLLGRFFKSYNGLEYQPHLSGASN